MKRISKSDSPEWFEEWKKKFEKENGRKPHYKGDFSTGSRNSANRRRKLREELLKEQGYICCYCMKRINLDSSHNEHFWPKEVFTKICLLLVRELKFLTKINIVDIEKRIGGKIQ